MAFHRAPPTLLRGQELEQSLRAIGLRLGASHPAPACPAPEQVLVSAVTAAIPNDLRTLSVVTTWLEVHGARVHVAELARYLDAGEAACRDHERFAAYWSGVAHWQRADVRWAKVAARFRGPAVYLSGLPADLEEAQILRKGEDLRFLGSRLRVPQGMLRDRKADVDDPASLSARHAWYRERVRQGPSYRADCWAELERNPELRAADLARAVGCTYPVAHAAVVDQHVWRSIPPLALRAPSRP
jgi:hypothetical protein